jgi:hypothetical protein
MFNVCVPADGADIAQQRQIMSEPSSEAVNNEQTVGKNGSADAPDSGEAAVGRGHEHEPLLHYGALMSTFVTLSGATMLAMRASGTAFPSRIPLRDVALLGLATSRVSRLITRDKVTRAIRAPFTEVVPGTPPSKVRERPRQVGDRRRAIGELLLCPRCVGMWSAMALGCGYMVSPGVTRFVAGVLATAAVSDFWNEKTAEKKQSATAS